MVIVEPPCRTRPAMRLARAERRMPRGEMPQCWKKRSSSMAMTAFCRSTGILARLSRARFSMENSATTSPLRSKTRLVKDGV